MENKIKQQLIVTTKSLVTQAQKENDLVAKITMIEVIYDNLLVLKDALSKEEYESNFKKLEDSINKIINGLTDPKFIQDVVSAIENLSQYK